MKIVHLALLILALAAPCATAALPVPKAIDSVRVPSGEAGDVNPKKSGGSVVGGEPVAFSNSFCR